MRCSYARDVAEGTMKTLLFDFVFALVIIGAFATAFTIFLSP